jgi:hypothetical protein
MKFFRRICLLYLIVALILSSGVPAFAVTSDDQSARTASGSVGLDAQKPVGGSEKLLETAKAAVLYEMSGDTMV